MTHPPRDPAAHLAWFLTLPETIRLGINERRVKDGLVPHGDVPRETDVHCDGERALLVNPPEPAPIPPTPLSATREDWNALLTEYRAAVKLRDETLSACGRGVEHDAVNEDIMAIVAKSKGLRPQVEKALGREMTEAERKGGFDAQP